jgi:hypothetical protein
VAPSIVMGIESRLGWCAALLRSAPAHPTGEITPPEDLTRITVYQHPDHDTPAGWRPAT